MLLKHFNKKMKVKMLAATRRPSGFTTSERQAFSWLAPHITLAPVMSPEQGCTLHSETVRGNQSSPSDLTAQQLTSLKTT